ncbi:DUF4192 domain-containing protein [Streptomyces chartreusis]|uniref:DUF4192 domain-containing protein n=1 Tax=Streptomyces chartreusis TaxID=1969 RepID=UPI0036AEC8E3
MTTPDPRIHVRTPGDFAELLPFLIGYQPEDTIALHGVIGVGLGTGPTMTLPIPDNAAHWQEAAESFAHHFLHITRQPGRPPIQEIVAYLCRTPPTGQSAEKTAESLRPLADHLTHTLRTIGQVNVRSIGLVDNRWWAYECPLPGCCEGEPLPGPDDPNSVTAQMIRLGRSPGRTTSDITQEFLPAKPDDATHLHQALVNERAAWSDHCTAPSDDGTVLQATHALLETAIRDFRAGTTELPHDITARLIYGLNDEWARDHGLEHIEDDDLPHTRRLWAYLARHAIPPHQNAAVPALTLLAAVAWRQDDRPTARHALKHALALDPDDEFAHALHSAINHGLDATSLLPIARNAKADRLARAQNPDTQTN